MARGPTAGSPTDISLRIAQRISCTFHRENARAVLRRSPGSVNGSSGFLRLVISLSVSFFILSLVFVSSCSFRGVSLRRFWLAWFRGTCLSSLSVPEFALVSMIPSPV